MSVELKVLTLNCWGITYISKDRRKRIAAIGRELALAKYDLVVLQEIWNQKDYEYLRSWTGEALPYSHYFHSGVIGSGVCAFSKGPIVDILIHRYSLNGYAHKVQHGDWFGGKVVGLCKISYQGLNINLYTTHIHAEYNRKNDEYLTHRISQAFELSQFVRQTGETSDLNILAGDLNLEPGDLGYKIVRENGRLLDSWLEQENRSDDDGNTCEIPGNSYTTKAQLKNNPNGKRIDYILYGNNQGIEIRCLSCTTTMGQVPNELFSYSDHEAVTANLLVVKNPIAAARELNMKRRKDVLEEALPIIEQGIKKVEKDKIFYFFFFGLIFCLMIITIHIQLAFQVYTLVVFLRIFFSIMMAVLIWLGAIMTKIEHSALISTKKGLLVILNTLQKT